MEVALATSSPPTWECLSQSMACDVAPSAAPGTAGPALDPALVERAYARCETVTALHSRTFHMATGLLPRDKRRAMRALYAFCRVSDDIVDCPEGDVASRLGAWRSRAVSPQPPRDDLVATAWADTRTRYRIPLTYAEQLIDGVARDLSQTRYTTFVELTSYAYGVASTVGLMSMHIIGFASPAAIPYAIKLGIAFQITNILRDVAEDWRSGRVYLPAEELDAYHLREDDLARGQVDERWRAFMRFQIARNRRLYAEAWPGIALLNRNGRLAVAAAGDFYRAILRDIEVHDYDVFHHRAQVSAWGKLRRLPAAWWHTPRTWHGHAAL
jgi:phytoene synthase